MRPCLRLFYVEYSICLLKEKNFNGWLGFHLIKIYVNTKASVPFVACLDSNVFDTSAEFVLRGMVKPSDCSCVLWLVTLWKNSHSGGCKFHFYSMPIRDVKLQVDGYSLWFLTRKGGKTLENQRKKIEFYFTFGCFTM